MARTAREIISTLPQERQKRIKKHSQELVNEYAALQELRKAIDSTHRDVAEELKISQDDVSRLEKRSDIMLSTLRKYIEATGGKLSLVAQFPGHPPVEITAFSENISQCAQIAASTQAEETPG